ncbi:S1C family serine protease [Thalassoroseus pseudoceratinae]|uniref:S1C family serine protease n=1 Tax=Thalassoroseus pseudoceratinae TaxID=2713176 RepID=UPI00141DD39F|nr:trypsin-like peptidase domain-containing protein [Thalassoroseus pseudoceratinae]
MSAFWDEMKPRSQPNAAGMFCTLLVFWGACFGFQTGHAAEPNAFAIAFQESLVKLIADVEPAVVSIARVNPATRYIPRENFNQFGPPNRNQEARTDPLHPEFVPNEFGAGVLFTPQGENALAPRLILTAYHVVKGSRVYEQNRPGASELVVRFADRSVCHAAIVAADPRSDLAVLRLYTPADRLNLSDRLKKYTGDIRKLPSLPIGQGESVKKGSFVLVFGNPYAIARDGSASVGQGMVSNLTRRPAPPDAEADVETIHHLGTLMQIDARLNLGSSGGAVVNLRGELVGITTAQAALEGYDQSVGYAIPLDEGMRRVVDELAYGYEVEYGLLGIEPKTTTLSQVLPASIRQASAAEITSVMRNSPAMQAGLQRGDVILSVQDQPVFSQVDLRREVGMLGPDANARLKVVRGSGRQVLTVSVALAKWPLLSDEQVVATRLRYGAPYQLGIEYANVLVDYPTGRQEFFDRNQYNNAVVITQVEPIHERFDTLHVGDLVTHVNRRPVRNPQQFAAALAAATGPELTLTVLGKPSPVVIDRE